LRDDLRPSGAAPGSHGVMFLLEGPLWSYRTGGFVLSHRILA
jgi:hypothetical protein